MAPEVFEYADYRRFLADRLVYMKAKNPSYSESAFIRQAGLGSNSRGYLGLIIKGKRNLSQRTIMGFAQCLKLSERETNYFENLVYFNQASDEKEKSIYFGRLSKAIKGHEGKAFELLKSQYNYFSNWYLVAIRELVSFPDFEEKGEWILDKLRGRLTRKQADEAIHDLLNLGMLSRDASGKLYQADELVQFTDNTMNNTVINNLHHQFLDLVEKSLEEDDYSDRSLSYVVLACPEGSFEELRKDIAEFRKMVMLKYGQQGRTGQCLLNMAVNLFHLTPVSKAKK